MRERERETARKGRVEREREREVESKSRSNRIIDLHWLPVKERIDFKILLLTFKALNGLSPKYISDVLTKYVPSRPLCSMQHTTLVIPKSKYKNYGDRSFQYAAPKLWNDLPEEIRELMDIDCFKSSLKTFLFKRAFYLYL